MVLLKNSVGNIVIALTEELLEAMVWLSEEWLLWTGVLEATQKIICP